MRRARTDELGEEGGGGLYKLCLQSKLSLTLDRLVRKNNQASLDSALLLVFGFVFN